ncbi:hypothetical protein AAMO2058_001750500 [Amorphochlora amoebiformis]
MARRKRPTVARTKSKTDDMRMVEPRKRQKTVIGRAKSKSLCSTSEPWNKQQNTITGRERKKTGDLKKAELQNKRHATSATDKEAPINHKDHNDFICAVCGDFGDLICCESCPKAFHTYCIDAVDEGEDEFVCSMGGQTCCKRDYPITHADYEWNLMFEWGESAKGKRNYKSFALDGVEYQLGDTVEVEGAGDITYIAIIESLYEDPYGKKWGSFRWYYTPEETMYGRLEHHLPKEVFISCLVNENDLQTVKSKCRVMNLENFKKFEKKSKRRKRKSTAVYICRQRYNMETGEYRPMIDDAEAQEEDSLDSTGPRPRRTITSDTDNFTKAAIALQLSSVPETLPCRSEERQQITSFVEGGIRQGRSDKGLYISGMPGTGKTATVLQVVRNARKKSDGGKLPPFKFMMLNAMKLPDPTFLYRELWSRISGVLTSSKRAALLLQKYFSSPHPRDPCYVLLVDEIDYIMNKKQDVIYNLFNWPSQRYSKLVVVGIANTMDLPERLKPRVYSRMGLRRLTFKAYTRHQIEEIIKARLEGIKTFDPDAIELCARKVSSTTGDVRKALQIARRAAEICKEKSLKSSDRKVTKSSQTLVTMSHISQAVRELFDSPYVQLIPHISDTQKFFLNALMLEAKQYQRQQVFYEGVADRFLRVSRMRGYSPDGCPLKVAEIADSLNDVQIIGIEKRKVARNPLVRLVVHQDDVHFALRNDELWSKLTH